MATLTKRMLAALLILSMMLLAGCGGPTLDASSEKSLQASIEAMASELDEEGKQLFAGSLMLLGLKGALEGKTELEIFKDLDGWTADEIIAEGKKLAEQ